METSIQETKLRFLHLISNRLKIVKDYETDQFLIAASMKDNTVRNLIILIMLQKIHPNYWMLGFDCSYDIDPILLRNFGSYMEDAINNFDILYKFLFSYNVEKAINFLKEFKVDNEKIEKIERMKNASINYHRCIIYSILNNSRGFDYIVPVNKFANDYCPVCMNEKMRYVWLKCGHNICKDCYEKLVKYNNSRAFKCPYCNVLTSHC